MTLDDYSDETLLQVAELLDETHHRRGGGLSEELNQFWKDILTELEERNERPVAVEKLQEDYAYDQ